MGTYGGLVGRKYATISRGGRKMLRSGTIKTFQLFDPPTTRRATMAMVPGERSRLTIRNRLVSRLQYAEGGCGLTFLLAEREYPFHITLLEGIFQRPDEESAEVNDLFARQVFCPDLLSAVRRRVQDVEFEFPHLLVDGNGNILLLCSDIPPKVLEARALIEDRLVMHGLRPLPLKDIFHATVARTIQAEGVDTARYERLLREYRRDIAEYPMKIRMEQVYAGLGSNLFLSLQKT